MYSPALVAEIVGSVRLQEKVSLICVFPCGWGLGQLLMIVSVLSSPVNTESTVVWSNGATQCDSTLQLNILVTINNIWWWVDNSGLSN